MSDMPGPVEASDRVIELFDDDDVENTHIHAILNTGENDVQWFFIVFMERRYEGERYLNERYLALAKPDADDVSDTFMKNGINRRYPDGLVEKLVDVYGAVGDRHEWFEQGERDPTETNPYFGVL